MDGEERITALEEIVAANPDANENAAGQVQTRANGMKAKTIGQWYDAGVALYQIVGRPRNLPMMAQYKLARMKEALKPVVEFVDAQKNQLVQELGEPVPADNPTKWQLKESNRQQFETRITEHLNVVQVLKIQPIRTSELGTAASNGIDAREFELLGDLVVDNQTE